MSESNITPTLDGDIADNLDSVVSAIFADSESGIAKPTDPRVVTQMETIGGCGDIVEGEGGSRWDADIKTSLAVEEKDVPGEADSDSSRSAGTIPQAVLSIAANFPVQIKSIQQKRKEKKARQKKTQSQKSTAGSMSSVYEENVARCFLTGLDPPTLGEVEHLLGLKLNADIVCYVKELKSHAPPSTWLFTSEFDMTAYGAKGMNTSLRHTLVTQRLFTKLSIEEQAKRADGVAKANVANVRFHHQQLESALELHLHDNGAKDTKEGKGINVTSVANIAHAMVYGPDIFSPAWCCVYQQLMTKYMGGIITQKVPLLELPHAAPSLKGATGRGASYKSNR
jgi:hypothetical protein